jgi:hypothetical protein
MDVGTLENQSVRSIVTWIAPYKTYSIKPVVVVYGAGDDEW